MTISFEEFEPKAQNLLERMRVVRALFKEAEDLFQSLDESVMDDSQFDSVNEYGWDIARAGNFEYGGEPGQGFWLPSTC